MLPRFSGLLFLRFGLFDVKRRCAHSVRAMRERAKNVGRPVTATGSGMVRFSLHHRPQLLDVPALGELSAN